MFSFFHYATTCLPACLPALAYRFVSFFCFYTFSSSISCNTTLHIHPHLHTCLSVAQTGFPPLRPIRNTLLWPAVLPFGIPSFMPPSLTPFLNQVNFLLFTIPVNYGISPSPLLLHLPTGAPSSTPSFPLDTSKGCVSTSFCHSGSTLAESKVFFPYLFSPFS